MRISVILSFLVVASTCVIPRISPAQTNDIPEISIEFPQLIDGGCSRMTGKPIDQDAVTELEGRFDEFVDSWQSIGPSLMSEAVAITGVPFGFHERIAVLHTCDGLRSMSMPLLVNARGFLTSLYPDDSWDIDRFATNFLFHEILHNYLYFSFGEDTFDTLFTEYGDLPPIVRNHLHLMSLEIQVFSRLGLRDAIAFSEMFYNRDPLYRQAAAIVEGKGTEYFIEQLR